MKKSLVPWAGRGAPTPAKVSRPHSVKELDAQLERLVAANPANPTIYLPEDGSVTRMHVRKALAERTLAAKKTPEALSIEADEASQKRARSRSKHPDSKTADPTLSPERQTKVVNRLRDSRWEKGDRSRPKSQTVRTVKNEAQTNVEERKGRAATYRSDLRNYQHGELDSWRADVKAAKEAGIKPPKKPKLSPQQSAQAIQKIKAETAKTDKALERAESKEPRITRAQRRDQLDARRVERLEAARVLAMNGAGAENRRSLEEIAKTGRKDTLDRAAAGRTDVEERGQAILKDRKATTPTPNQHRSAVNVPVPLKKKLVTKAGQALSDAKHDQQKHLLKRDVERASGTEPLTRKQRRATENNGPTPNVKQVAAKRPNRDVPVPNVAPTPATKQPAQRKPDVSVPFSGEVSKKQLEAKKQDRGRGKDQGKGGRSI